ncbi:MAG: DUF3883 domain-containing protein [Patescibacteria group bacterium]|nr:MAG: DUF3883 domain-containing protein [Patescibacteria group bacterium]
MKKIYRVPDEYNFRLHHIRPRFKNDVENVLFFMASEISKITPAPEEDFARELNKAIRRYPGNASKAEKTIDNWRTEITALFGLIEYDGEIARPGRMANLLAESQDLIEFFRYFLFYFQYPGGHLKPHESLEFIEAGVRFKPAKYLLQVLLDGKKILGENAKFGITKAEATHCIFNDLRVTRDGRPANKTAELIISNRNDKAEYPQGGDIVRYAGDILDYMVLADLVRLRPNYKYYLNPVHFETIQAFVGNNDYFEPYESLYKHGHPLLANVTASKEDWFHYVNNKLDSSIFEADAFSIIEEAGETVDSEKESFFIGEVLKKIRDLKESESINTKEVGDVGEAIVIEHEKNRMMRLDRESLLHLIKKIPESYAMGYDINSFEGIGEIRRYIEVKTSISRGKLAAQFFHMTPSEWSSAETLKDTYFVYRLMISAQGISLFLIQDPVGKYKSDRLSMAPRDGADIHYTERSGNWEELLV